MWKGVPARLLLVEDDRVIGRVLESALRRDGYDVRWHPTGRDAVRDAEARAFELALVDLGLPDVDGLAVCHRLRELRPECVVVVVTARDEEVDLLARLAASPGVVASIRRKLADAGGARVPNIATVRGHG